ncbi:UNKNOWN [Stylonychia lemnae]|uniref:Uncharacterized protein n=1 Tax=Stylonychia lemnae TaxID=5949 RepID=A0A078AVT9_STYLE|nr:UNKNOWN [Stylonychia lemnae]|eukprot:CDW85367.1 UNKNOWN [Stylonychia lemnae]
MEDNTSPSNKQIAGQNRQRLIKKRTSQSFEEYDSTTISEKMDLYNGHKSAQTVRNPLVQKKGKINYKTLEKILSFDNTNNFESCFLNHLLPKGFAQNQKLEEEQKAQAEDPFLIEEEEDLQQYDDQNQDRGFKENFIFTIKINDQDEDIYRQEELLRLQREEQKNLKVIKQNKNMDQIVEASYNKEIGSYDYSQKKDGGPILTSQNNFSQSQNEELKQDANENPFDRDLVAIVSENQNEMVNKIESGNNQNVYGHQHSLQRMDTPMFVNATRQTNLCSKNKQALFLENGQQLSVLNLNFSHDPREKNSRDRGNSFNAGTNEDHSWVESKLDIDMRKVFRNQLEITQDFKVLYSVIEETKCLEEPPYPKITQRKFTLIFELIDVLIKIVDTTNENFFLQDITIQEITYDKKTSEIVTINYSLIPLDANQISSITSCEMLKRSLSIL